MFSTVYCQTSFEGVHCYPQAPKEVGYLRDPHRHTFGVRVEVEVRHDDREIEFIMMKHKVESFLRMHYGNRGYWLMNAMSCEMVATLVIDFLKKEYGENRYYRVTIDEDGENGSTVRWRKKDYVKAKQCQCNCGHTLSLNKYQDEAWQAIQEHEGQHDTLEHWVIGLTEEAGEVSGCLKHMLYTGEKFDKAKIAEELGDVLWYVNAMCTTLDISLETVAELNLAKLRSRFPNGEFDESRNLQRHALFETFKTTKEYEQILSKLKLRKGE